MRDLLVLGGSEPGKDTSFGLAVGLLGSPIAGARLLNLSAPQAPRTDPDPACAVIDHRTDALKIRFPGAIRDVVRVAYAMATDCTFIADFATFRHVRAPAERNCEGCVGTKCRQERGVSHIRLSRSKSDG